MQSFPNMSALKDQMASITEAMLKIQKSIEDNATAAASNTAREAKLVLQPAMNLGRDRNVTGFNRRYSPQAYPYGLPPDFTPRTAPDDLSQAPTFEGQLPPHADYPLQEDDEGDAHLGPLLPPKEPAPHELPKPNIIRHAPSQSPPVKELVPISKDKGKIDLLEERERIESGLRKGKFEYASNAGPNSNRRAPVVGTRKKEGDTHTVTTAPTWMKTPQNAQNSYQHNHPNFSIRAGSSLPTQVEGLATIEKTLAQHAAPTTPRPANNTTPGASYNNTQRPPRDEFSPIPMAYSELWPSLLENHLVVAIPGKVFQSPYPKWYNSNATCAYHSGAPGHNIDSCLPFKYKVQHLINAGWLSFQEEGPNVKTNPLASHGGASVNAIEKDSLLGSKRLEDVATSRRFIYQSLQAACMVSRGGDKSDECLFYLGESHDMETCPAVEDLLQRLMDWGQLEVSERDREEPQICTKAPPTPKALVICFTRNMTGPRSEYPPTVPKPTPFSYQSNKAVPWKYTPPALEEGAATEPSFPPTQQCHYSTNNKASPYPPPSYPQRPSLNQPQSVYHTSNDEHHL
ncbi:hypothetical protein HKD37_20G056069 [Glycine soja]